MDCHCRLIEQSSLVRALHHVQQPKALAISIARSPTSEQLHIPVQSSIAREAVYGVVPRPITSINAKMPEMLNVQQISDGRPFATGGTNVTAYLVVKAASKACTGSSSHRGR